jgi:hypothetical protein
MTAEAGPGPSTMASSPIVPNSAKKLRIKKRMINIVNPAGKFSAPLSPRKRLMSGVDPESFSVDQSSLEESPEKDRSNERRREVTPMQEVGLNVPVLAGGTPLGSELTKRGILRPSGTPGSGNGGKSMNPCRV